MMDDDAKVWYMMARACVMQEMRAAAAQQQPPPCVTAGFQLGMQAAGCGSAFHYQCFNSFIEPAQFLP
jgi:hypothetical protein